jgi:hypothetical protein
MKRCIYALLALCLLTPAAAQQSVMVTNAEPLRFAFAIELMGIQLEAVRMGGVLDDEDDEAGETDAAGGDEAATEAAEADAEDEDEVEIMPLDLFAGTLSESDPGLHERLAAALEEVEEAAEEEDAGLDEAVAHARSLLEQVEALLVPAELQEDPSFRAAVLARLALSGSGFAEGYEEAAEGEVGAYIFGWAGLQRAKALWAELEPAVTNPNSAAELERVFAVLDDLMASPTPPERFRDPEDAEVAAHDLVFALETAFAVQLQPRDLAAVLDLVDRQSRAACAGFEEGRRLPALELAISAQVNYVEGIGGTVALLAPGPAGEIRSVLSGSLPELIDRGEPADVRAECARLRSAISEAATIFR